MPSSKDSMDYVDLGGNYEKVKNDGYLTTAPDSLTPAAEHQHRIHHENFKNLENEFRVREQIKGPKILTSNPLALIGGTTMVYFLFKANTVKNDAQTSQYLNRRSFASLFFITAVTLGMAKESFRSRKWIDKTASERGIPIEPSPYANNYVRHRKWAEGRRERDSF